MQQGIFDLLLAERREEDKTLDFPQEGRLGCDKLFNLSGGLSWNRLLQLNCRQRRQGEDTAGS